MTNFEMISRKNLKCENLREKIVKVAKNWENFAKKNQKLWKTGERVANIWKGE